MNKSIEICLLDFDISHEEFVLLWNSNIDCSNAAEASIIAQTSLSVEKKGVDPIVLSIATGVASSVIYDLIKLLLNKLKPNTDWQLQTDDSKKQNSIIVRKSDSKESDIKSIEDCELPKE